jgi:hypothetical protein
LKENDNLILINNSRRPLTFSSLHGFSASFHLIPGQGKSLKVPKNFERDILIDRSKTRRLKLRKSLAYKAFYLSSHQTFQLEDLPPGYWKIRISHPRIPALEEDLHLNEGKTTKKTFMFRVGRLPSVS